VDAVHAVLRKAFKVVSERILESTRSYVRNVRVARGLRSIGFGHRLSWLASTLKRVSGSGTRLTKEFRYVRDMITSPAGG
jgi:hypothetical protein